MAKPARYIYGEYEINLDDDPDNADWTKQEWDLPFPPDPENEQFREWLRARGLTFEEFKKLPAWRHYRKRALGSGR